MLEEGRKFWRPAFNPLHVWVYRRGGPWLSAYSSLFCLSTWVGPNRGCRGGPSGWCFQKMIMKSIRAHDRVGSNVQNCTSDAGFSGGVGPSVGRGCRRAGRSRSRPGASRTVAAQRWTEPGNRSHAGRRSDAGCGSRGPAGGGPGGPASDPQQAQQGPQQGGGPLQNAGPLQGAGPVQTAAPFRVPVRSRVPDRCRAQVPFRPMARCRTPVRCSRPLRSRTRRLTAARRADSKA